MSTVMKKPTGVYILAILFLLAPIGNILISFVGSGVSSWHQPDVLSAFLQSIPAVDWIWLGLLFVTGLLLFRPHKLSWSVAIFTLLIVLIMNAYRLFTVEVSSIDPTFLKVFSLLAIICTLAVLIIAFYFRFPYLDRRANWISNTKRYDLRTSANIAGHKAVTESISISGCRLTFDDSFNFKMGEEHELKLPEISAASVKAEVVELMDNGCRIEFNQPEASFKRDLSRWLKSRKS